MIKQLKSAHYGKSIAVVGSGPSALKFKGEEQISIALNAAVVIDYAWNYFCGFDTTLGQKAWWPETLKTNRIMGYELCGMVDRREQDWMFDYTGQRKIPELPYDFSELTNVGNIAIPAVEAALIMGAHRLVLYGIDLNQRVYFDNEPASAGYGVTAPRYMQTLLGLAQCDGIDVEVVGSEDCKIRLVM